MKILRMMLIALGMATSPLYAQKGVSQDGAKPADGAIKGGTILPGEQSGVPDERKMRARCEELSGTLREDCLKQQRDAGLATEPRTKSPARGDSAAGS